MQPLFEGKRTENKRDMPKNEPQLVFIYIDRNPAKVLPFNIGYSSTIICKILDLLSYTQVTETLWW